jgi:hypothetical protein
MFAFTPCPALRLFPAYHVTAEADPPAETPKTTTRTSPSSTHVQFLLARIPHPFLVADNQKGRCPDAGPLLHGAAQRLRGSVSRDRALRLT